MGEARIVARSVGSGNRRHITATRPFTGVTVPCSLSVPIRLPIVPERLQFLESRPKEARLCSERSSGCWFWAP